MKLVVPWVQPLPPGFIFWPLVVIGKPSYLSFGVLDGVWAIGDRVSMADEMP